MSSRRALPSAPEGSGSRHRSREDAKGRDRDRDRDGDREKDRDKDRDRRRSEHRSDRDRDKDRDHRSSDRSDRKDRKDRRDREHQSSDRSSRDKDHDRRREHHSSRDRSDKDREHHSKDRRDREHKSSDRDRSSRDKDRDRSREHRSGDRDKDREHRRRSGDRSRDRDREHRSSDRKDREHRSSEHSSERSSDRKDREHRSSRDKEHNRESSSRTSQLKPPEDRHRRSRDSSASSSRHGTPQSTRRVAPRDASPAEQERPTSSRRLPTAPTDSPRQSSARTREQKMLQMLQEAEAVRAKQPDEESGASDGDEDVKASEAADEYEDDYDDDDFEAADYEDDFEDDDDDDDDNDEGEDEEEDEASEQESRNETFNAGSKRSKPQLSDEALELRRAMEEENRRLMSARRPRSAVTNSPSPPRTPQLQEAPTPQRAPSAAAAPRLNFQSAKKHSSSGKVSKRWQALSKLIELDVVSFSVFELQPLSEYELYIRSFGQSNAHQVACQTNDDCVDREVQAEDIDTREKWTQAPANDLRGWGWNEEEVTEEELSSYQHETREESSQSLARFLRNVGQVCGVLLEETSETKFSRSTSNSSLSCSVESTRLSSNLPILAGRSISSLQFCAVQPNLILTAYSAAPVSTILQSEGLLCVWNLNEATIPQYILGCNSDPTCCCFSPNKASLVFAGLTDGGVAVWDLREPPVLHKSRKMGQTEYTLRMPSYETVGVMANNHQSPIVSIEPVSAGGSDGSSWNSHDWDSNSQHLAFQLASLDQDGMIKTWTVVELPKGEWGGSDSDLGLNVGARVKLVPSATILFSWAASDAESSLQASAIKFFLEDPNHFVVATNSAEIIHGVQFGDRISPRAYRDGLEFGASCTALDFSPFLKSYFLAGFDNGDIMLFKTSQELPVLVWRDACKGGVRHLAWSRARPALFFVHDSTHRLHIWDLLVNDRQAVGSDQIVASVDSSKPIVVTAFAVSLDQSASSASADTQSEARLAFALSTGAIEAHQLSSQYSSSIPDEAAQVTRILENLL
eukprot:m.39406 g.39406  ORF g.39406 m.39406 type:complete len:1028 (+) comp5940_c0_seq4:209-3292(+)